MTGISSGSSGRLQASEQVEAIAIGEQVVEQDAVEGSAPAQFQALGDGLGDGEGVRLVGADAGNEALIGGAILGRVFNEEDVELPGGHGEIRCPGNRLGDARRRRASGGAGQKDDLEPVVFQELDGPQERLQADRLLHVAIGAGAVATLDVAFVGRGGEHDDRDRTQPRLALDLGKNLPAIGAGQVEIEKDQTGSRGPVPGRRRRRRW